MSKIIKGVGKAVKGIVKGIKKVFKKVWESDIGRALLIAGMIYIGGGLAGVWSTPFASVNSIGASVKAATWGAGTATATATGGVNTAALAKASSNIPAGGGFSVGGITAGGTGAAGTAGTAGTAGAAIPAGGGFSLAGTTASGLPPGTAGTAGAAIPAGGGFSLAGTTASGLPPTVPTPTVPAPSLLNRVLQGGVKVAKGVYDWSNKNPLLAATALQAGASALSPDELDLIREREKLRNERIDEAWYPSDYDPDFGFGNKYILQMKQPGT